MKAHMKWPILYHKGSSGKIYSWQISTKADEITQEYGTVDGAKLKTSKKVKGKNIGKKNETTPTKQAESEAESMWKHKLERKYRKTIEECQETIFLPMLAHDWRKLKKFPAFPLHGQAKLNGVRCMAFWDGDKVRLMSRQGKDYNVEHIRLAIEKILSKDTVLDGELFIKGMPLQDINSLVKKPKAGSENLEYWCYDLLSRTDPNLPYVDRSEMRRVLLKDLPEGSKLVLVDDMLINDAEQVKRLTDELTDAGYEGLIIRVPSAPYELGHRSRSLLKYKLFMDAEFEVVGFKEADGTDKGTVVWTCKTPAGKLFDVRPQGTREGRALMLQNAKEYMGQFLTVKFQEYSKDEIPIFPVGVCFRLKEDMPEEE